MPASSAVEKATLAELQRVEIGAQARADQLEHEAWATLGAERCKLLSAAAHMAVIAVTARVAIDKLREARS